MTAKLYPSMRFTDASAALQWLQDAFGFSEHAVHRNGDGSIVHAELALGDDVLMFGQGDPREFGVYIAVDDLDAHHARAKAAGAEIVRELADTDYGSREYAARDLDGHVWYFGTYRP